MELLVTEHKSRGTLNAYPGKTVRVFVNGDVHYGYFVEECALFAMLTPEQQATYLERDEAYLDVEPKVAQAIIDIGHTPYGKQKVF